MYIRPHESMIASNWSCELYCIFIIFILSNLWFFFSIYFHSVITVIFWFDSHFSISHFRDIHLWNYLASTYFCIFDCTVLLLPLLDLVFVETHALSEMFLTLYAIDFERSYAQQGCIYLIKIN